MNGFNATVFAYGATGCGKTFTISGTPSDPGIIPLTMQELFERVKEANDEKSTELSLSYLEVYNETIRDLLIPPGQEPRPLALREDNKKGVTVAGLSEHHPKTVDEVMELVMRGNECRTMSPTEANATSSRSHAVLQVHIRMKPRAGGLQSDVTTATLSLIDLAGSERGTVTKNRGERMREGANINRSLLALANCINALCDPKKNRHIPYRDSKLTRLLKFSLGGNCRTVMITCVSPASTYYEETYNTLKYANRAKNIKTTVAKNTVSTKVHLAQYQQKIQEQSNEIKRLQRELAELRRRGAAPA
ncbi:tubulin-dependent ATPase kip3, partial [Spiromyces aspiralis]